MPLVIIHVILNENVLMFVIILQFLIYLLVQESRNQLTVFLFSRNSFFIANLTAVKIKLIHTLKKYTKNVEYIVSCIHSCFAIDVTADTLDDMHQQGWLIKELLVSPMWFRLGCKLSILGLTFPFNYIVPLLTTEQLELTKHLSSNSYFPYLSIYNRLPDL